VRRDFAVFSSPTTSRVLPADELSRFLIRFTPCVTPTVPASQSTANQCKPSAALPDEDRIDSSAQEYRTRTMTDVTKCGSDEPAELLARQRALQTEAEHVRAQLDLAQVPGAVDDPVLVGSAALGLMAWRDIDITVVCPSLEGRVIAVAAELAVHQDVKAMQYRDDSGRWNQDPEKCPDGLYIGLRYHPAVLPEWKLDLWFVDDPARQPDLAHLRTLPGRLTDDARLAILRIKTLWSARPQYGVSVRSWDIYTAVLDHNVRDTDEFARWLTRKQP
jgi:hypothetical protein